MRKIPWGASVLKQANDERPSEERDLAARVRRPIVDDAPKMSIYKQHESLWNDVYNNHSKAGVSHADAVKAANEKIQQVQPAPKKSASDESMEDKRFTEELHSRKSDGRFIESSGNSSKKYTHKES